MTNSSFTLTHTASKPDCLTIPARIAGGYVAFDCGVAGTPDELTGTEVLV
jgi:hypothetical protein